MPVHFLGTRQVASHPGLEISHSAAGITVESGRKIKATEPADSHMNRRSDLDQQLVGARQNQSPQKGLLRRSAPKVDIGPCPGMKATSSPSGQSRPRIDAIKVSKSPFGKSVRPIDP